MEGKKARRKGPTSCQTIPSRPHHNKVSYHISQHHQQQHHPQNFTHPTQHQPGFCSFLTSRHCIALQSKLTAQALDTLGTNRAGDSVSPTAVQLQVRCVQEQKHTQPLRPIAIPLRHQALAPGDLSPRDLPPSSIYTTADHAWPFYKSLISPLPAPVP